MKMKKENMDHIRERFEKETGTALPEKNVIEFPEWAGRMAVAAAGIVCMVALGLVWYKVSEEKQKDAEMMLAAEDGSEVILDEIEDDIEVSGDEETEEEYVETEEDTEVNITFKDDNGEEVEIQDATEYNVDIDLDEIPGLGKVGSAMAVINADGIFLSVYKEDQRDLADGVEFEIDGDWVWPVPAAKKRGAIAVNNIPDGVTEVDKHIKNEYLAVMGNLGDAVVAMHTGTVTAAGFDTERGNFIDIEMDNAILEYRHLDEIKVSAGDVVRAGDEIGTLGNSGQSTGPHLGITIKDTEGQALSILFLEGTRAEIPEDSAEIIE